MKTAIGKGFKILWTWYNDPPPPTSNSHLWGGTKYHGRDIMNPPPISNSLWWGGSKYYGSGELKNQHNPASKDSIPKWIVNTIKIAYTDKSLEGVRAHNVRSFSSSWPLFQGTPIEDIMEAASWKSENTFTSFYMRDMCRNASFGRAVMAAAHSE